MKTPISTSVFLILALAGWAAAEVPKKAQLSRYARLWSDSPFTTKPPPPESVPDVNPLEDYALLGVSPLGGNGYRVTITNKKNPDGERLYVETNRPNGQNFKVLEVIRKTGDPLGTTVRMSSGSMTGTVSFDEKMLTLAKAPPNPAAPPQGQPQMQGQLQPPGTVPPPLPNGQVPQRQPRPRVIPPPIPPPTPQGAQAQPTAPLQPQNVRLPRRR
jgi:hypothetical protein